MAGFFGRLRPCSSSVLLASIVAFFTPLYASEPGSGSVELSCMIRGSHAVTEGKGAQSYEGDIEYSRGNLALDIGAGYFFTNRLELMTRLEWSGGSYRSEREDDYGFGAGGSAVYSVSGLAIVNHPTRKAGLLFLVIGGGVIASGTYDPEPVRFPIVEAGTRVFLGETVSVNVAAYYERRRFDYGMDDLSASSLGLKAGLSFFPLTAGDDGRAGR